MVGTGWITIYFWLFRVPNYKFWRSYQLSNQDKGRIVEYCSLLFEIVLVEPNMSILHMWETKESSKST